MSDPSIFFAAERTLLAWFRSGLTVMALGFVVARFGLVGSLVSHANAVPADLHDTHRVAHTLGIALMAIGAVALFGAWRRCRLFVRSLPPENVPPSCPPMADLFLDTVSERRGSGIDGLPRPLLNESGRVYHRSQLWDLCHAL